MAPMHRVTVAIDRALSRLLRDRRVPLLIAAVYVAFGLVFVMTDYALNDEGLCIHIFASWARLDFVPAFFFQKGKPVLELVYMLPSAAGVRATMAVHVALGALAIPMIAAAARRLGHTTPNLPALVLAFSPIYFFGGAAGIENVDGVLGTTLFVYLLVCRRDLLAGIVLGMLPWIRSELALVSGIFFLHAIFFDRRRRLLLGALAFPLLFTLAGAVYHHDPLWLLHFPPATSKPMPGNPVWVPVTPAQLLENLLSVSPLIPLALSIRPRRLEPVERALGVFGASWFALLLVLPVFRLANFGFVPRYALQLLPVVALFVSRSFQRWQSGERPGRLDLAIVAALCILWLLPRGLLVGVAVALVAVVTALALARTGRLRAALALSVVLACVGPALPNSQDISTAKSARYLAPMTRWVVDNRARLAGPVYTNAHLLEPHLANLGELGALDLRFLVGVDMDYELVRLTNASNGQRAAILRLARREFYGHGVLPGDMVPGRVPDGAVFVLRADQRVNLLLPPGIWARHLEPIVDKPTFRVLRFVSRAREVAPVPRKR